jgi:protoheme IX farnesyltransferase
MKTATLCPEPPVIGAPPVESEPLALTPGPAALVLARAADYLALTKPRVAVLVLFTVAAGALLAGGGRVPLALLVHAVLGTALVAGGASALNQLLERNSDARMRRTENRPLPAGRLAPVEVLFFGGLLAAGGAAYLALALPRPEAAVAAVLTFVCYVFVYTPLKARTPLNTLIGAVPGAMPPVIGWCAVRGALTAEAVALFIILFLWQVPHFLAIAWMYRDQYGHAGLRMLPVVDPHGTRTSRNMITWCLALIPASLVPAILGEAGLLYLGGALLLGVSFLASAVRFQAVRTVAQARRVLRTSLLYLPGLLALLLLDRNLAWLLVAR